MTNKGIKKKICESPLKKLSVAEAKKNKIPLIISYFEEFIDGLKPKVDKRLIIKYKDYSVLLSSTLLQGKCAWGNLDLIKKLQIEKFKVFKKMEKTDDKLKLRAFAEEIEQLDFKLQKAWNFPEDRNFHEWYNIPKCICPKSDNKHKSGTEYRVIRETCPVHGH